MAAAAAGEAVAAALPFIGEFGCAQFRSDSIQLTIRMLQCMCWAWLTVVLHVMLLLGWRARQIQISIGRASRPLDFPKVPPSY